MKQLNPEIVGAIVFVITGIGAAIIRKIEKGRDRRRRGGKD